MLHGCITMHSQQNIKRLFVSPKDSNPWCFVIIVPKTIFLLKVFQLVKVGCRQGNRWAMRKVLWWTVDSSEYTAEERDGLTLDIRPSIWRVVCEMCTAMWHLYTESLSAPESRKTTETLPYVYWLLVSNLALKLRTAEFHMCGYRTKEELQMRFTSNKSKWYWIFRLLLAENTCSLQTQLFNVDWTDTRWVLW
jgi:hypothetical protein